ncbi:4'-phosphopantetheinyl transferase EntD [Saccharopolyspora erythraea NRRL 2338]|uniref:4'-phosphopantetheinyl transferase superfamily protein n=1 Tax=Saccharopolyspora erythraea TaxID=1836 RepID=Q6T709_SACER|nr:4'-phosphopantetheinyl transferase [Saccharopolyspora erythraea]AAR92400.1 Sfp-type phosphopantetheinyl transferase [Saccharopolyspora erythraea]EQD81548.1 4'-phosphopantetheinyl transferase [Saccharopolyspora erythraea D]PFG96976.1 4'-phosphopantetheinyl transferase EntD [Saccharopolyspora erythraea NRRL 2338]QRK87192.1 4'-phosphopantetheinyl transferase [Saccharopolyspora erythraea]
MIERVLPEGATWVEAFDDPAEATLFPEEEAAIARAVDKRRREFTTVRHCARRAMAELGVPPAPLLPGERGAPQWPAGVVGSMTHCAGYRAAVVGPAGTVVTIGIDAEPHEPLPGGVLDAVSLPEERARLRELSTQDGKVHWDRVLFSCKESVYKAWFPLTGAWLDFEQADLTFDAAGGTFHARLLKPGGQAEGRPLTEFTGRWLAADGFVVSAIVRLRER